MKKHGYTLYLTDPDGRKSEFWQICWTRLEIQVRMGWTAYRTRKAIETGQPTEAGRFWVVVKKRGDNV